MNKVNILLVGKTPVETASITTKRPYWIINVVTDGEKAIELMYHREFDIVILDHSLEQEIKNKLNVLFGYKNEDTFIAEHFSESGNLFETISNTIRKKSLRNLSRLSVHDYN